MNTKQKKPNPPNYKSYALPKSGEAVVIDGKTVSKDDLYTGDGRYIGKKAPSES
jgi:hypothetical protein